MIFEMRPAHRALNKVHIKQPQEQQQETVLVSSRLQAQRQKINELTTIVQEQGRGLESLSSNISKLRAENQYLKSETHTIKTSLTQLPVRTQLENMIAPMQATATKAL